MRGLLYVIASFGVTILAWGLYGPVLHRGQAAMSLVDGSFARLRPFVCVGLAYFAIGVVVPAILLATRGEKGTWNPRGIVMSLFGGALGAIGALGIIMAFTFGGKPSYVMPLVFGGAPVVNAFLTIYWAKRFKDIGPFFLAGLLMVILGAATVLICKPAPAKHAMPTTESAEVPAETLAGEVAAEAKEAAVRGGSFILQLLSIATVVACWGAYGPVLHIGQAAMQHSRLRPLLCVGLAYFAIAVVVPWFLLAGPLPEASAFMQNSSTIGGSAWSLAAGAAGAIGALGIILAFNFGGKPIYVMPLVFGGAPVVTTLEALWVRGGFTGVPPWQLGLFFAGLMLVIAGAAMVLIFAPKGTPPKMKAEEPTPPPEVNNKASEPLGS